MQGEGNPLAFFIAGQEATYTGTGLSAYDLATTSGDSDLV